MDIEDDEEIFNKRSHVMTNWSISHSLKVNNNQLLGNYWNNYEVDTIFLNLIPSMSRFTKKVLEEE